MFQIAARRLGVPASKCVGFEDAEIGLAGGKWAGYKEMVDVRNDETYPSHEYLKEDGRFGYAGLKPLYVGRPETFEKRAKEERDWTKKKPAKNRVLALLREV